MFYLPAVTRSKDDPGTLGTSGSSTRPGASRIGCRAAVALVRLPGGRVRGPRVLDTGAPHRGVLREPPVAAAPWKGLRLRGACPGRPDPGGSVLVGVEGRGRARPGRPTGTPHRRRRSRSGRMGRARRRAGDLPGRRSTRTGTGGAPTRPGRCPSSPWAGIARRPTAGSRIRPVYSQFGHLRPALEGGETLWTVPAASATTATATATARWIRRRGWRRRRPAPARPR